jgi:aminopeptidase N
MKESRLYRLFQPKHYTLRVNLEREQRHFSGTVTIQGTVSEGADAVWLHAHKLHITEATIDGKSATFEHGDADSLSITTEGLQPGDHEVVVSFEGKITNPMHGLYPCYFKLDGKDEELLATQFESHHAREVFPCVDEPEAKATFDLTLESETDINVVSNTPVKEQTEQDDKLVTSFETTPVMSTYLLAWVAGKLDYKEATTKDGVVVRTYATRGKGNQLDYALKAAVESLETYNDYFGVPYPLPKADLVALPDFSSGAMENWGITTYRESVMLVDEHSSTRTKQYVVMVIAHELAHQWFGDLVTMKWWNDLWLNESFANWMEYYVTDKLHPEWEMMTQYFDDETTYAIEQDSLSNVQKIQQEVHSAEEIQTLFDPAIVYAKGGSLINMLHTYLGPDMFRKGLQLYFERHKYGNTEAADLWKAWGEASGRDVMGFMQPWITQAGLPVITVGEGDHTVELHQRRFFSNPKEAGGNDQTVWPVPLLSNGQLSEELLDQRTSTVELKPTDTPLLLNQGRTGYYLTMYSTEHVEKLAAAVRDGKLSIVDRLGLLTDSLSLSEAALQPYLASLKLLDSYRHEDSYPVWGAITSHLGTLKMFADDDEELLAKLRGLIRDLVIDQHNRLGWDPINGESYFDGLLRPLLIAHMAYSEDEPTITKLRDMFDKAEKPSDVWGDIRATVFSVAAKFGDEPAFEKLLSWHNATTSAEQRTQLIAGMCAARNPKLIQRSLDMLTTDAVKLQDLFYWIVYLTRNRYAKDMTWQWIQDNWKWIVDHFGNDMHYTDFPKYAAGAFSKPEQLESYRKFFEPMLKDVGIERTIRQGLEDIEGRILWRERDGEAVAEHLRSYKSSSQDVTA